MQVAFINENTLGHASYLLPFVRQFETRAEWGIEPRVIAAAPLPGELAAGNSMIVRALRKCGLDRDLVAWRLEASRYVSDQFRKLCSERKIDAVVVNTHSVGLALNEVAQPLFVCLDATFAQLARSDWFAPRALTRWLVPALIRPLRQREQRLLRRADRLLAWSEAVRQSLVEEYGIPRDNISLLPPSVDIPDDAAFQSSKRGQRPQALFIGGDFHRKGGPLLLKAYRRYLAGQCDLHLVTHTAVQPEAGVFVHRSIAPGSEAWLERWKQADVFVFPSRMETFGIVILEALAFGVPVVSAEVGAARDLLAGGANGWLLRDLSPQRLAAAIQEVLDDADAAALKAKRGREQVRDKFNLATNASRLAKWLRASACGSR